ncbi:MAG: hypothetical protein ABTD50_03450 [Polyangiaceae bacterium]|jgi:hypothetical protein
MIALPSPQRCPPFGVVNVLVLGAALTGGCGRTSDSPAPGGGSASASHSPEDAAAIPHPPLKVTGDGTRTVASFDTASELDRVKPANPAGTDPNDLTVHGNPKAVLRFDGAIGYPERGSLEVHIPCTAYGQYVDYLIALPGPTDLRKKVLSARIRLDDGFSPELSAPGGVVLYAKSGDNWDWGQAAWVNVSIDETGTWKEYTFELDKPAPGSSGSFDAARVQAVGIKFDTGSGEGAAERPSPAVFHVDTMVLR